jgi:tRNA A37 threonylcarbamoyladenosine synthetase subunit TsaC/SUA5/YrdC
VLNNGQGSFQISNEIMLTLLGGVQPGMAIPSQIIPDFQSKSQHERNTSQITAQPPLILDFNTSNATQTVHFDDQNNMFVLGSLPS